MAAGTVRVLAAGFSPVKGTRHLRQESIELDADGALGDRGLCLVDVTARRVLRTVQHPGLLAVVAALDGDALQVTLPTGERAVAAPRPSGETLTCDYWGREVALELLDGPHAGLLGRWLGREVRLARAPRRGVIFGAGVTLVTRESLDALEAEVGPVDPARFRATLLVESGGAAYAEDDWLGREIRVGEAVLRVGAPIPRCAVVDADPVSGERSLPVLKALVRTRPRNRAGEPVFGVYAEVVAAGPVRSG